MKTTTHVSFSFLLALSSIATASANETFVKDYKDCGVVELREGGTIGRQVDPRWAKRFLIEKGNGMSVVRGKELSHTMPLVRKEKVKAVESKNENDRYQAIMKLQHDEKICIEGVTFVNGDDNEIIVPVKITEQKK